MALFISIADPSSYETLGQIFNSVFSPALIHQTIFKGCSSATTINSATESLRSQTDLVVVSAQLGNEQGKIVGYATWKLPVSSDKNEEPKVESTDAEGKKSPGWPEGKLAEALFINSGGLKKEGPHYCVDPAYQKQGIGAALLQYGIEKADKNGLEIHVRSNIEGLALYEKFGFLPYGEKNVLRVNDAELVLITLYRPPTSSTLSRDL